MKLWQKIFLWSLVIVMIAVSATNVILLRNNFQLALDRQVANTRSEHEYLISNMKNRMAVERQKSEEILLTEEHMQNVLETIFERKGTESGINSTGIVIYDRDLKCFYENQVIQIDEELLTRVSQTKEPHRQILIENDRNMLVIGSYITMEQGEYLFFSCTDITDLYQQSEQQQKFAKYFSVALSVESALFLLALMRFLMAPLGKLNRATRRIAQGDYSERVIIKGHDELSNLADNMNMMADAIEEKVNLLSETAENRRQFIDNFSHEMKTPLTSILGFADLMRIKRTLTQEELYEYSNIIFEEASRLKSLSGKMMELITVGETNLEFRVEKISSIFSQIEMVLTPALTAKELSLHIDYEEAYLQVDSELFKSLILNLIDNAIKASEKEKNIWVHGYTREMPEDSLDNTYDALCYIIEIRDEGIGIPKESLSKIVEPFYMVDKARSRKAGGAGLGLALCKRIAQIHNAKLLIESELGVGTTVTLMIPVYEEFDGKPDEEFDGELDEEFELAKMKDKIDKNENKDKIDEREGVN